jgi:hypothetical protein
MAPLDPAKQRHVNFSGLYPNGNPRFFMELVLGAEKLSFYNTIAQIDFLLYNTINTLVSQNFLLVLTCTAESQIKKVERLPFARKGIIKPETTLFLTPLTNKVK